MELPSVEQGEPISQTVAANDYVVLASKEDVTAGDCVVRTLNKDKAEEDVFENDPVSSIDQPNTEEQFAAASPMIDVVQESVEDVFEDQSIKESLLFEDALTEVHRAAWFIQSEHTPIDDAPLFLEFKFGFKTDFQPTQPNVEFDVDLHTPDAIEMLHHQLRPPEEAVDLLPLPDTPHDLESQQVLFPFCC